MVQNFDLLEVITKVKAEGIDYLGTELKGDKALLILLRHVADTYMFEDSRFINSFKHWFDENKGLSNIT